MWKILGGIAVVLIVAVMVPYFLLFHYGLSTDREDWITFGTYLGGTLGPGFSLLAFIGFLYTILLQRTQIRIMQKDFRAAEKERRLRELLEVLDQKERRLLT